MQEIFILWMINPTPSWQQLRQEINSEAEAEGNKRNVQWVIELMQDMSADMPAADTTAINTTTTTTTAASVATTTTAAATPTATATSATTAAVIMSAAAESRLRMDAVRLCLLLEQGLPTALHAAMLLRCCCRPLTAAGDHDHCAHWHWHWTKSDSDRYTNKLT